MRLSDVNVINVNYRYRAFSLTWSAFMQIIGTKGGVCLRKELDSHSICLGHQQNSLYPFPGYCSCSDSRNISYSSKKNGTSRD